MCIYNGADYLGEQLASIAAQSRLPDELVVCDDGSQDDSVAIVQKFAEQVPFEVRIYQNEYNMGSSKNFEQAIGFCRGDIIFLADQDDRWKIHKLETISEEFLHRPEIFYIFTDADLIDQLSEPLKKTLWDELTIRGCINDYNEGNQFSILLKHWFVTGATLAFRASLRDIILPIPEQWVHDAWIALIASATHRYGLAISETLLEYRRHVYQQIGLRRRSLLKMLTRSRSELESDFDNVISSFQKLRDQLEHIPADDTDLTAAFELLNRKIEHCIRRRHIFQVRWGEKLRIIESEYRLQHYAIFSKSWKSILKDIWIVIYHGIRHPS